MIYSCTCVVILTFVFFDQYSLIKTYSIETIVRNCSMAGAVGVAVSSPQDRKSRTSPAKIRQGCDQMLDTLFHPQCAIIVKCLGLGLGMFRDPDWDSPNCRRHAQFVPAVFSKSLRFRRLK